VKRYRLTEAQATAILDLQLRRLAALERKKIDLEYKEVTALIKDLEGLLKSAKRIRGVAAEELQRIKSAYADRRRTQIVSVKADKTRQGPAAQESLPEQAVWVGITADGHMARTAEDKLPRMAGGEAPRFLVHLNTTDVLYLVSTRGTAAAVSPNIIPQTARISAGPPYFRVSPLKETDTLAAAFALPSRRGGLPAEMYVLTVTRQGLTKKTSINELPGASSQSFTLARVNEGDALLSVALTDGAKEILLFTAAGMAIRFHESEVRAMGLQAAGVSGVRLDAKDAVVGAEILPTAGEVFLVTTEGKAKRVEQKEFPAQGRYGKGVTAWSLSGKARLAGTAVGKGNAIVAVHLAKSAPRAHHLEEAGIRKRAASRGERLFAMKPGDDVTAITSAWSVERFIKIEKPEQKPRLRTPHAAAKRSAQKASRAGAKTARPSAKRRPKGAPKRKSRKK